jgi:hypothetical protein
MRWHSESFHNKVERQKKWHIWFAWHPIYLDEIEKWIWLEKVERMIDWQFFGFPSYLCTNYTKYRLINYPLGEYSPRMTTGDRNDDK